MESRLVYEVGSLGSGITVEVSPGTLTDGASVPIPLRGFLPAWGRYSRAALVHDQLYALLRTGAPHPAAVTRLAADRLFREAMTVSAVPWWQKWPLYAAVRLCGARYAQPDPEAIPPQL